MDREANPLPKMNEMDEIGRSLDNLSINRFDVFEKWLIDAGAKVRIDITCVKGIKWGYGWN